MSQKQQGGDGSINYQAGGDIYNSADTYNTTNIYNTPGVSGISEEHFRDLVAKLESQSSDPHIPARELADLVEIVASHTGLPIVSELDPYRLGSTTSLVGDSVRYGEADPYVLRTAGDADDQLGAAIHSATLGGPMIVLVGPSKSGKTRTAYEALRRHLPQARLAAPFPGLVGDLAVHESWRTTAEPIVLWLDDLNRFITTQNPLTPSRLASLMKRPGPVIVLATLRSEERNDYAVARG